MWIHKWRGALIDRDAVPFQLRANHFCLRRDNGIYARGEIPDRDVAIGAIGRCGFRGLLLPASAQCLVELHESQQFIQLGLRQAELGGEIIRFVSQHL